MYKTPKMNRTEMYKNDTTEADTIEGQMEKALNNKEPLEGGAPIIFTEKSEGVKNAYNIRTDRWEIAIDGIDRINKSYQARREEKAGKIVDLIAKTENGGAESTQDTNN